MRIPIPLRQVSVLSLIVVSSVVGTNKYCYAQDESSQNVEVVPASAAKWQKLNPKRGDKSPQAATLWGDRNGKEATGFLVKFIDGFSSPPHIHNVTYRGVVIEGRVHNDDPQAKPMWMPTGSFWTQPAGEAHITSARNSTVAYIEIESGPYLVMPTEETFDNGERPVNIDRSNIVWQDESSTNWIEPSPSSDKKAEIAFLWGSPHKAELHGTLVKLPGQFSGTIRGNGSTFKAVVIAGESNLHQSSGKGKVTLAAGSYLNAKGKAVLRISCDANESCTIYIRSNGKFTIASKL
ncbi:DUF4437 domain-containing protein [Gimesia algae]|uniref:DUF4437 domain-containing protein n=1 Tax=Gimesia algae TaxID=2527971 RepID=A0A517V9Y7_9PLAN|nr:DUF4437 domain-containing protein [Gimesia algae]QDT89822.1 hypothetical protein Pan161_14550 [Gimesia algae]